MLMKELIRVLDGQTLPTSAPSIRFPRFPVSRIFQASLKFFADVDKVGLAGKAPVVDLDGI